MELSLRPYQQECVDRVLSAYQTNPHSTELVVAPCAWGKTVMFAEVIRRLGVNTLVICHRDELIQQAIEKYRMIKPDAIVGQVGSGLHQYGGEVTVASIATISRPEHLKHLKAIGYGLIVTDEGHHSQAISYQKVYETLPEAFHLMVTATSDRLDGKPIIDKPPLYSASIIDMIGQGYLCDVKAIAIRTETDLSGLHTEMGDYKVSELSDAVDTPGRNRRVVEAYKEYTMGKRAVAFCVTVAHAQHLASAFNEQHVPAAVIAGETPLEERKRIYKAFHAGDIKVMTNVMVLSEGWDEPLCEVGIGARPTQSRSLFVQQFGRILRLAPGKLFATWIDLSDNCLKHRLEPQNLKKVLGKAIKDQESLLEAIEREKRELEEGRTVTRRLPETRKQDLQINILEKLLWQERTDGLFVLEVGTEKHKIALVPVNGSGLYDVCARLAPLHTGQWWLRGVPLDWAQNFAERRARLLLADPQAVKLVDRNEPWRGRPASEAQLAQLAKRRVKFGLSYDAETVTKGEAADMLDPIFQRFEDWRAQKKARVGV